MQSALTYALVNGLLWIVHALVVVDDLCPCYSCWWCCSRTAFTASSMLRWRKKKELFCLVAAQGQCSCHDVLVVLNILHQHLIRARFGRPAELPGAQHQLCWTYSSAGRGRLGHAEPGCRDKAGKSTQGGRVAAYVPPALRFHQVLLMYMCISITVLSYGHLNLEVLWNNLIGISRN